MNNKGFAVSIIVYSIVTVIVLVLFLILALDRNSIKNKNNLVDKIKEEISGLMEE